MEISQLTAFFGWATIISSLVLFMWVLMIGFMRAFIYKVHSRWFKLPTTHFDTIHYCGMGLLKLFIWLLFLTPYLALKIIF